MAELLTSENLVALLTLTALEIVLGIDNIVFISILCAKLPPKLQARGRQLGLALAMGMRIVLLLSISWVMGLTEPLFSLLGKVVSGRDLILLVGGLFLLGKATWEIHDKLEGADQHGASSGKRVYASFGAVLVQIAALDVVFSLDSVITAVGMADHIEIMVVAVVIAVLVMMIFAGAISRFVEKHPTLKMLALSFLILIGAMLILEGFGTHVEKGYIYFAMAFSLGVELLNMRFRKTRNPVGLKQSYVTEEA
ncbi:MAG: TerC family protein [Myxococcales bacterium]|nr:TerC family protein [Myxococcales bacterium]